MASAQLMDGVGEFLHHCRATGQTVFVVSHKTEFAHYDKAKINLRKAAFDWMSVRGFFSEGGFALRPNCVYFESSRAEKLHRIGSLQCHTFIDDLEEVLLDPNFPKGVRAILFSKNPVDASSEVVHCSTWRDVSKRIFDDVR